MQDEIKASFNVQNGLSALQQFTPYALSALGTVFTLGATQGAAETELAEPAGGFKYLE